MDIEETKKTYTEAFSSLKEPIFRYVYFKLFDREKALEITQDVFMKTWDYIRQGKEIENIPAFVYKTAYNLVVNEYRKKRFNLSLEELNEREGLDPPSDDNIEENTAIREETDKLLHTLNLIPQRYRDMVYLKYISGLSIKEISNITGESKNNVSVMLHRGVEKLREIYNKNEKRN